MSAIKSFEHEWTYLSDWAEGEPEEVKKSRAEQQVKLLWRSRSEVCLLCYITVQFDTSE